MYNPSFYGYYYSCNLFGHNAINLKYSQWRRSTLHTRYRYGMSSKRFDLVASYLVHVECYTCDNFGHMVRDCMLPCYSRKNYQEQYK